MLDRSKIVAELQKVSTDLFVGFAQEIDIAEQVWRKISIDTEFEQKVKKTKQSLLSLLINHMIILIPLYLEKAGCLTY